MKHDIFKNKNPIRVATVFSGIGSPEQALKRLGVKHNLVFACDNGDRTIDIDYKNEYNRVCSLNTIIEKMHYSESVYNSKTRKTNFVEQSFKANYDPQYFFQDINLIDGTDFYNSIDLFVGGSPCQSFSITGKGGGFNDTRGTLFYQFARLIKEIHPSVFIYENVANVLRHDNGNTWNVMKNVFSELGYFYSFAVLNAKDYGIPQSRKRLFVVGFKTKESFEKFRFPDKQELTKTVFDFLEDNHAVGSVQSVDGILKAINEEKGVVDEYYFLTPGVLKYVLSPGTKGFYHPNIDINKPIAKALLSTMHNHHRTSVDNYYTTNGRVRELTVTEGLRLMGFPDDFNVVVSKPQMYRQIGNSIVVDVMMAVIKSIVEVI